MAFTTTDAGDNVPAREPSNHALGGNLLTDPDAVRSASSISRVNPEHHSLPNIEFAAWDTPPEKPWLLTPEQLKQEGEGRTINLDLVLRPLEIKKK